MGYIRHKAYIFTDSDNRRDLWDFREIVVADLESAEVIEGMVTPIFVGINGYASFAVLPDGSKEWWTTSDMCDKAMGRAVEEARLRLRVAQRRAVHVQHDPQAP